MEGRSLSLLWPSKFVPDKYLLLELLFNNDGFCPSASTNHRQQFQQKQSQLDFFHILSLPSEAPEWVRLHRDVPSWSMLRHGPVRAGLLTLDSEFNNKCSVGHFKNTVGAFLVDLGCQKRRNKKHQTLKTANYLLNFRILISCLKSWTATSLRHVLFCWEPL